MNSKLVAPATKSLLIDPNAKAWRIEFERAVGQPIRWTRTSARLARLWLCALDEVCSAEEDGELIAASMRAHTLLETISYVEAFPTTVCHRLDTLLRESVDEAGLPLADESGYVQALMNIVITTHGASIQRRMSMN